MREKLAPRQAKLMKIGTSPRPALEEVNVLAAKIAREAAGDHALVAGVIGPSGKLPTMGEVAKDELVAAFAEQARALDI